MKKLATLSLRSVLFAFFLVSGCAVGDWTPYAGRQQTWPTQPGSFVKTNWAVPVYINSWPDRPYTVLGYLTVETAPIRRRFGGPVAFAAKRAKDLGADAIIVMDQGERYAGSFSQSVGAFGGMFNGSGFSGYNSGTGYSHAMFFQTGKVIAIRYVR